MTEPEPCPEELLRFIAPLHQAFEPRRRRLLAERREALARAHAGEAPGYLPESEATRGDWRVELPEWARDQRNQITGPADNAKLVVAMTGTGDPGCMPDGEDSIVTEWTRVREAQKNTIAAIRGQLTWKDPDGRETRIKPSGQLLFYRPRGLHLDETRALPGETLSASLFDLAAVFHATADLRRAAASRPELRPKLCFYVPKVESKDEAACYSELFSAMEEAIGVATGSTKIMLLIESLPAAYQIEEILHATRRHAIGLNLGRWDYMASLLHFKLADPDWILPDRNTIPHDVPFFQNLRRRLVEVCHKRGALAIGGMTALFPDRRDAAVNARALEKLAADKKNEAALGFDGAWTGHPDQHAGAIGQFPAPNQLGVRHPDWSRPDLTPPPSGVGAVTSAGTRDAIRTVIEYRFGVLSGLGARMIKGYAPDGSLIGNFMEDLATDRIYRLMIAQRAKHRVRTAESDVVTETLVKRWFDEELEKLLSVRDADGKTPESATAERYTRASAWSQNMIKEAIAVPEGVKTWSYPAAEIAKMYAPLETVNPCDKLRTLLREKFERRHSDSANCFLHTAGAYDAVTASLLTDLGFEAIYASGWQLAVAHNMYPDIGIYPSHMMVDLVRELVRGVEGTRDRHFYDNNGQVLDFPPIFADIEAGFGGPTQTFTLTRELIRAGVAGVHLEDQDPAERTCGHIVAHHGVKREKVLVPTHKWIEKLVAVKAAAQATRSGLVVIARTDAVDGAVPGGRGGSVEHAIDRALEAASLGVDVIWPEFNDTSVDGPARFAEGVHKHFPNQMLGFNLSPSLHWGKAKQSGSLVSNAELGKLGYVLQFSTLLAFRTVGMALEGSLQGFRKRGLDALADLQLAEIARPEGEPRTRMHQRFAGTNRWLTLEKVSKGA